MKKYEFFGKNIFLLDEEIVNLCAFASKDNANVAMTLLRAISDYCAYGCIKASLLDDKDFTAIWDIVKDRVDKYLITAIKCGLREAVFDPINSDEYVYICTIPDEVFNSAEASADKAFGDGSIPKCKCKNKEGGPSNEYGF